MLYVDSNIFICPVIYDEEAVVEAEKSRDFLLRIAFGKVEAYASSLTWDEVAWVVRKLFGIENSINEEGSFLASRI